MRGINVCIPRIPKSVDATSLSLSRLILPGVNYLASQERGRRPRGQIGWSLEERD